MKALAILNGLCKDVIKWENQGIHCTVASFELKEAISELEAMLAPKTCADVDIKKFIFENSNPTSDIDGTVLIPIDEAVSILSDLKIRISELEALQAPKTCDGCKYDNSNKYFDDTCLHCVRLSTKDYYEPKDLQ